MINWILALVIGGLCGFAANKIMKGNTGSILWNVVLGLAGGAVGKLLGMLIKIGDGLIGSILLAIAGSCLVVWVGRKLIK